MFLFRLLSTHQGFFFEKANEGGKWWNSPEPKSLIYRWLLIYKSHLETASFARLARYAKLLPEMPGSNVGLPIPETFNGWKMTDLLGWRFFFRGSVSWRFKLGRLLHTSRYIPKNETWPLEISGWEVYDPLRCKDAICFSASQVDSFRGMYMANFEECTTLLGQFVFQYFDSLGVNMLKGSQLSITFLRHCTNTHQKTN